MAELFPDDFTIVECVENGSAAFHRPSARKSVGNRKKDVGAVAQRANIFLFALSLQSIAQLLFLCEDCFLRATPGKTVIVYINDHRFAYKRQLVLQ